MFSSSTRLLYFNFETRPALSLYSASCILVTQTRSYWHFRLFLYLYREVLQIIGQTGDFNAELMAILFENNLDVSPYRQKLLQGLPDGDYVLTDADIADREDWRNECVFTIDPATAVDLDDAVSCKILENGNYEVIFIE